MANWHQLELFFKKKTNAKKFSKLLLENIEGTIHEKQGAAEVRFQIDSQALCLDHLCGHLIG